MIDQGVFKENNRLIFKDYESVQKLAEKKDRTLVIFEDNVYDVTDFLDRHPGNDYNYKIKKVEVVFQRIIVVMI